ncbi:armadillo repeat-containing protein 8-like isoform X1 [Mercenaria mercenaria]|uniref:armadillo repeat-containing protein 8-like isoform X1 n=1 Tax=Mercenaria mercenaria TaxID=6596 RepID=UPI001E1DA32C|nr:armadillo repeat-containing protein 8-like isoform X1 [Mercenaria mercenaria]
MLFASMEIDGQTDWYDTLHSDEPDKWQEALIWIKNAVIGNNKQKSNAINHGAVPRLLQWLVDEDAPQQIRTDAAIVMGSIAKGTVDNINTLVEEGSVAVLLKGLSNPSLPFVEACLRCLRTIFISNSNCVSFIYQDPTIIPHLVNIMQQSVCTQECITNILANSCQTTEQQNKLCKNQIVPVLVSLIAGNVYKVQMPTLKCLAVLVKDNDDTSDTVAKATHNGEPFPNLLVQLLYRDKTSEMQILAAKVLAYMCRGGAIDPHDPKIAMKTLPCLIRMCSKDRTLEENVEGAETLAYLLEVDATLQRTASISERIIKTLSEYLKYTDVQQITRSGKQSDIHWGNEMKQAAFKAFAALGANEEDIRKQIIETENLMDCVVAGLNSSDMKVAAAAIRCLHSLSRSVQLLRTTFQDHAVWKPLMKIIQEGPEELLQVSTSTLCNLLLEFSPSKECILDCGAINILVGLTSRPDPGLRLNGIWGLMNMTFQVEQKVKSQVVEAIGTEQLFRLLSDPDANIVMKTLGLLRNLLSNKLHIDNIMNMYGNQIMQAVIFILEGDHPPQVKEQTLCILANVADGDQAKEYIMGNEDVLKKLMNYMLHLNVNLQIAATTCISNLVWNEEEGAYIRQAKLREMGVQTLLQKLLSTNDSVLFEKVKTALQQFT